MVTIYERYDERHRELLKREFDTHAMYLNIEYAVRDAQMIEFFLKDAREQVERIKKTAFKRYIDFRRDEGVTSRGKNRYPGKPLYSVLVYTVPQVPDNKRMKVFDKRFSSWQWIGDENKDKAVAYVHELLGEYPDAELIGNAVKLIKR